MIYLLVDDDEMFRFRLAKALERRGCAVLQASSAEQALQVVTDQQVHRVLLDLSMPGESGLEILEKLLTVRPHLEIVILTGFGSITTTQSAIKSGAIAYLTKPCEVETILKAFEGRLPVDVQSLQIPSLAMVEWEHIQRVLHSVDGNITKAAKILGLDRRSLQRKLAKAAPS